MAGVSGRHSYRMTLAESETRFCRCPPDMIFPPSWPGRGRRPIWTARGLVERVLHHPLGGVMSIGFERVELVGDRVRLRPAQPADTADAYRLVSDEEVLSRLLWEGPANEEEMSDVFYPRQEDIVVVRNGE